MSARISIDCTRPFVISEDETKESKTWGAFIFLKHITRLESWQNLLD
jgi:hypothetical protein